MRNRSSPKNQHASDPSARHPVTTDDLRRVADHCQDLDDPALMAKAWDEPAPHQERLATGSRREFGRFPDLEVPADFDGPLSDAEIAAWEGN